MGFTRKKLPKIKTLLKLAIKIAEADGKLTEKFCETY
jgi:hypothetical protein